MVLTEETDTFESLDRVLRDMDECFMDRAYRPHDHTSTIEEMWQARGVAEVMDRLRELYLTTYGEPYVPGSFRRNRTSGEPDASSSPGASQ